MRGIIKTGMAAIAVVGMVTVSAPVVADDATQAAEAVQVAKVKGKYKKMKLALRDVDNAIQHLQTARHIFKGHRKKALGLQRQARTEIVKGIAAAN